MSWPLDVEESTLNVVRMVDTVEQGKEGQFVFVAAVYVPVVEDAVHVEGTLFAADAPQEAGTALLRAADMVRMAA